MLVTPQELSEERRTGGEDDFVCRHLLLIIAGESYVEEVAVVPELSEGATNICLEVIPLEAELFARHFSECEVVSVTVVVRCIDAV